MAERRRSLTQEPCRSTDRLAVAASAHKKLLKKRKGLSLRHALAECRTHKIGNSEQSYLFVTWLYSERISSSSSFEWLPPAQPPAPLASRGPSGPPRRAARWRQATRAWLALDEGPPALFVGRSIREGPPTSQLQDGVQRSIKGGQRLLTRGARAVLLTSGGVPATKDW